MRQASRVRWRDGITFPALSRSGRRSLGGPANPPPPPVSSKVCESVKSEVNKVRPAAPCSTCSIPAASPLAASNWNEEASFVGMMDLSYRPRQLLFTTPLSAERALLWYRHDERQAPVSTIRKPSAIATRGDRRRRAGASSLTMSNRHGSAGGDIACSSS